MLVRNDDMLFLVTERNSDNIQYFKAGRARAAIAFARSTKADPTIAHSGVQYEWKVEAFFGRR
jgi:hypothetical protein